MTLGCRSTPALAPLLAWMEEEAGKPRPIAIPRQRDAVPADAAHDSWRDVMPDRMEQLRASGRSWEEVYDAAFALHSMAHGLGAWAASPRVVDGDLAATLIPIMAEGAEDLPPCERWLCWLHQYWITADQRADKDAQQEGQRSRSVEQTQYFTERPMVEWLVQNTLWPVWVGVCKRRGWGLRTVEGFEHVRQGAPCWAHIPDGLGSISEARVIDPAVGTGLFLLEAFDLLTRLHEAERMMQGQRIDDEARRVIARSVLGQLWGFDVDARVVGVARCALWLRAWRYAGSAPKATLRLWAIGDARGSLLEPSEQPWTGGGGGPVLIERTLDGEGAAVRLGGRWDVVVGNPPYLATSKLDDEGLKAWITAALPLGKADLYTAFIERWTERLTPGGALGFAVPLGWTAIASYAALRQHLLYHPQLRLAILGDVATLNRLKSLAASNPAFEALIKSIEETGRLHSEGGTPFREASLIKDVSMPVFVSLGASPPEVECEAVPMRLFHRSLPVKVKP